MPASIAAEAPRQVEFEEPSKVAARKGKSAAQHKRMRKQQHAADAQAYSQPAVNFPLPNFPVIVDATGTFACVHTPPESV